MGSSICALSNVTEPFLLQPTVYNTWGFFCQTSVAKKESLTPASTFVCFLKGTRGDDEKKLLWGGEREDVGKRDGISICGVCECFYTSSIIAKRGGNY